MELWNQQKNMRREKDEINSFNSLIKEHFMDEVGLEKEILPWNKTPKFILKKTSC